MSIGKALWKHNARSCDRNELRKELDDQHRPWPNSIVRALENEGTLLRHPTHNGSGSHEAIVYDALAGHIIGKSLLEGLGVDQVVEWLAQPGTVLSLTETSPDQHPLGGDVIRALVGLIPRRYAGRQLWSMLKEPLRTEALRRAALLEGSLLDSQTVDELAIVISKPNGGAYEMLERLFSTRAVEKHPLNSTFLDRLLRSMSVGPGPGVDDEVLFGET